MKKDNLKIQKSVTMATKIICFDKFLNLCIISYYVIYNTISFQDIDQKISVFQKRSIFLSNYLQEHSKQLVNHLLAAPELTRDQSTVLFLG